MYDQPGIDASTGVRLDGTSNGRIYAGGTELAPNVFTAQAWIKTNTTSGGRILGFGDLKTGNSGHRDRHLYMQNDGKLAFGVWAAGGMLTIVSPKSYNDNQWHQVTATFGPSGMQLYVDGVRVATRGEITEGQQYLGYWRVGGDNLTNWPSKPSKNDFTGSVDEVAIYPTALTQQQIDTQWVASGRTSLLPAPPADSYGAAVYADQPVLYWRLGEASGTAATDSSTALSPGTYRGSGWTLGQTGAITGTTNKAARSAGSSGFVSSNSSYAGPQIYSIETWFKSTSTQGGKLIGFGNSQTGNSATTTTDRTSTCRTTASSSSASSATASRRSPRPGRTTTGSGTTSSERSLQAASRSTSMGLRSAPTRLPRRRPTAATGESAGTRRGVRRAAS